MAGTWSSGGNLATARQNLAGAGSQTAGLCMGGLLSDGKTNSAATEEYTITVAGGSLLLPRRNFKHMIVR